MEAAAAVSESKVAQLRRASPAAQSALLAHLAMMEAQRPMDPSEELWCVSNGTRCLVCVAVYLPHGIALRLLENGDIRRTELLRDGPSVDARSGEWREKLRDVGWIDVPGTAR